MAVLIQQTSESPVAANAAHAGGTTITGGAIGDAKATARYCGGLGITSLYKYVALGVLPKPVKIGTRSLWLRHEVDGALARLAAKREAA